MAIHFGVYKQSMEGREIGKHMLDTCVLSLFCVVGGNGITALRLVNSEV